MRFLLLAIVIGFPLVETALLLAAGQGHAAWVVAWLVLAALVGVVLIKEARFALVSRLAGSLAHGQFSLAALIDSGRTVLAGLLLIFPGLLSDVMAITLLLLPVRAREFQLRPATWQSRGGVIEGEYQRDR